MTRFVATRPIVSALIGALFLIGLSFGLKRAGIDATRTLEIVIGLGLAFYANFIPTPTGSELALFLGWPLRQSADRFQAGICIRQMTRHSPSRWASPNTSRPCAS